MNSKLSKKFGTGVMVLLIMVCFIPAIAGACASGDGRQDKRDLTGKTIAGLPSESGGIRK